MQPPFSHGPIRETQDGTRDPAAGGKDNAEAQWRQALLQFFREQRERIQSTLERKIPKSRKAIKAIEDVPTALDEQFWSAEESALMAVVLALLQSSAVEGAGVEAGLLEAELAIGVDWTQANGAAAEWAREHAAELVSQIVGTTSESIAQTLAAWLDTPGSTMGELFTQFQDLYGFSEARAQLIAVTEVTQAYAEGGAIAAREMEDLFRVMKVWHTNRDHLVCIFCGPLDGAETEGVDGDEWTGVGFSVPHPPLHPRCRCWVTYRPEVRD